MCLHFQVKMYPNYYTSGSQENQEIQAKHLLEILGAGRLHTTRIHLLPLPSSDSESRATFLIHCYCLFPQMLPPNPSWDSHGLNFPKPSTQSPNAIAFLLSPHTCQAARCWPWARHSARTLRWHRFLELRLPPTGPTLTKPPPSLTCTDHALGPFTPPDIQHLLSFSPFCFRRGSPQQYDRKTRLRNSPIPCFLGYRFVIRNKVSLFLLMDQQGLLLWA